MSMICPHCNRETSTRYFKEGVGLCEECHRKVEYEEPNDWNKVNDLIKAKQLSEAVNLASNLILKDHYFKTIMGHDELWHYEEGVYVLRNKDYIKNILESHEQIRDKVNSYFINEVVEGVKRKTFIEREDFEAPINLICVGNGNFNIETEQLEDHSPELYFKSKINIDYKEDAKCPQIEKFVNSVVDKPELIKTLLEIPAYLMYRRYSIQKAIMLNGTNDNGKSVYIQLLEAFVGKKNVSSEELQQICHNNHRIAELFGKLLNSCADLPAEIMEDTGSFKKLTADDNVSADRKFGQPFQFRNYAKLIFSANEVPDTKDRTPAFYKRWLIIDFPYRFKVGLKEEEITDTLKPADPLMISKITTKEELEGLLYQSLNKLKTLIGNGYFSYNPSVEDTEQRYNLKSNSAVVFIETEITDSPTEQEEKNNEDPFTEKAQLWRKYIEYCKEKRTMAKPQQYFYAEILKRWFPTTERKQVGDKRAWCYVGIRYLNNWEEEKAQEDLIKKAKKETEEGVDLNAKTE